MSGTDDEADEMRQPADWMVRSDDRILELLRAEGNLTPAAIEALGGPTADHASRRCSALAEYGLVERPGGVGGLYRLTDRGRAYLAEELDAGELEPVDE